MKPLMLPQMWGWESRPHFPHLQVLRDFDTWKAVDGEHQGEVVAPKSGIVVLRWSNEFLVMKEISICLYQQLIESYSSDFIRFFAYYRLISICAEIQFSNLSQGPSTFHPFIVDGSQRSWALDSEKGKVKTRPPKLQYLNTSFLWSMFPSWHFIWMPWVVRPFDNQQLTTFWTCCDCCD